MLSDEQIECNWQFLHDEEGNPPDEHDFARAIEAEVRKQDEALIEQMHVALKNCRATGALDDQAHALASTAITAARARLGETT